MGSTSEHSLRFSGSTSIGAVPTRFRARGLASVSDLLEKCYRIPANKILVKADAVKQINHLKKYSGLFRV